MADENKKLTELTSSDKELVKNLGVRALPDNPSAKGFNAAEIKAHYERPVLAVFDKLDKSIKETNEALNDIYGNEADLEDSVQEAKRELNFKIDENKEETDNDIATLRNDLNSGLSQKQDKLVPEDNSIIIRDGYKISAQLDSSKYPTKQEVNQELQNIREVAAGKKTSFILTASSSVNLNWFNQYYMPDGTSFSSKAELEAYIAGRTCANPMFLLGDNRLMIVPPNDYYILVHKPGVQDVDAPLFTIVYAENLSAFMKLGDDVYVTEASPVPDRWYDGGIGFYVLDTKTDLTGYARTDTANTFSAGQTFSAGTKFSNASTPQYFTIDVNIYGGLDIKMSGSAAFSIGGSDVRFHNRHLLPANNNINYSIGAPTAKWKSLYLGDSLNIGSTSLNESELQALKQGGGSGGGGTKLYSHKVSFAYEDIDSGELTQGIVSFINNSGDAISTGDDLRTSIVSLPKTGSPNITLDAGYGQLKSGFVCGSSDSIILFDVGSDGSTASGKVFPYDSYGLPFVSLMEDASISDTVTEL